jgi:hypothetical protein
MYYSLAEIAQAAGIFAGACAAVVYAFKKNGKITFGKAKERRACVKTCTEHQGLAKEVRVNTIALEKVDRKVSAMAKDLNEAVGYIKAKTGGNL